MQRVFVPPLLRVVWVTAAILVVVSTLFHVVFGGRPSIGGLLGVWLGSILGTRFHKIVLGTSHISVRSVTLVRTDVIRMESSWVFGDTYRAGKRTVRIPSAYFTKSVRAEIARHIAEWRTAPHAHEVKGATDVSAVIERGAR